MNSKFQSTKHKPCAQIISKSQFISKAPYFLHVCASSFDDLGLLGIWFLGFGFRDLDFPLDISNLIAHIACAQKAGNLMLCTIKIDSAARRNRVYEPILPNCCLSSNRLASRVAMMVKIRFSRAPSA